MKTSDKFNKAMAFVFGNEGGISNHPKDRGGFTNLGISMRFLLSLPLSQADIDRNGVVNDDDLKVMTHDEAKAIYQQEFWLKPHLDQINDECLAIRAFDMCVNMGNIQACKLLQRACWPFSYVNQPIDDGRLGVISLRIINSLDPVALLNEYKEQAELFYKRIIARDPSQMVFEKGWLNRLAKVEMV